MRNILPILNIKHSAIYYIKKSNYLDSPVSSTGQANQVRNDNKIFIFVGMTPEQELRYSNALHRIKPIAIIVRIFT